MLGRIHQCLEFEVAVDEFIVHTTKILSPYICTMKTSDISQK